MLEPSPPTILWYTTPERASWVESADLSGIHLLVTTEPTPGLTTDMVVLDTRAFSTTQELIRTRDGFTCPALLLTTADNVAEVLPHVGSDDEVALCDLPWPLLVHRIKRMLDRTQIHLDSLTRIPDRLSFLGWLALRTPQASAAQPVSMLLVDIDHFKAINDVYGHNTGDRILRRLAARLEEYLAAHVPEALLSRFGGEEFAILVDRDEQQTLALGQQLLHIVSAQPLVSDIILTVSIGAASSRRPVDPQQLIAQADQAIYACKAQGRNMALHYDAMAREAMRRGEDMDVTNFEHVTRVVADRVADLIARRSQKLFKSVKQEANRDALTGLPNRRYLDRLLTSRLEEAARMHHPLVFALIDIDHFGNINKTWGWPTGDKALVEVAQVLRHNLRAADELARYGGEELGVVMMGTSVDQAVPVLERLRQAIAHHPFTTTDGNPFPLTISVGVAQRRDTDRDVHPLLERTSQALLHAKRNGRDQICLESDIPT